MSLIKKYKPETYDDIVGNNKKYKTIEKEILENKVNKYIITGKSSLGKTSFVEIFCKKNKYLLIKKSIEEEFDENLFLFNFFQKKVVLIDDIILTNLKYKEKTKVTNKIKKLIEIVNKHKRTLIIIISDKNIKDFKKINNSKIITLRKYKDDILINHIKKVCDNENIKYSQETYQQIFEKIINVSKGNMNKIYLNIETLLTNNKKTIRFNEKTRNKIDNRKEDIKINDSFELFSKTFYKFDLNNSEELFFKEQLYFSEPFLVSNHIRENYIKLSSSKYKEDSLDYINTISYSLSNGDIIDRKVHEKQLYNLSKYSTYMNGIIPMYHLQGKYKCFFNFPSIVNKDNNILNSINKITKLRQEKELFNYTLDEIIMINNEKLF